MKKHILSIVLGIAALSALSAQTAQAALTPEAFLGGHSQYVSEAVFSPDGRRIVTASWDKTVKLWNTETGQLIRTLTGHGDSVLSVAFSPDGRRIATGSDAETIKLWNAETGQVTRTLTGDDDWVNSVAFSPDGRRIITGSDDKTAKLWNAETGQVIRTLAGHDDSVSSAAFSPDGRHVATASWDKTVKLWNAETGQVIRTLTGHDDLVLSVTFSPDGRRILSGSADNIAKLWDAETGRELTSYPGIPAPLTRELLAEYLNAAGANAKTTGPLAGAALYKATPKETALQFGLLVYKAMQESRFLANTAAAGKYEEILRVITGRGNVSRAEIEAYYRQGIAGLVAEAVDEQFNKINFQIRINSGTSYDCALTCNTSHLNSHPYFNLHEAGG